VKVQAAKQWAALLDKANRVTSRLPAATPAALLLISIGALQLEPELEL